MAMGRWTAKNADACLMLMPMPLCAHEIFGRPELPANFCATAVSMSVSVMLSLSPSSLGGVPQQAPHSVVRTVIGNATL